MGRVLLMKAFRSVSWVIFFVGHHRVGAFLVVGHHLLRKPFSFRGCGAGDYQFAQLHFEHPAAGGFGHKFGIVR